MQLSEVFGYVAWWPAFYESIVPQVRSPYYGHLFVADFMGGSSSFRVSELPLSDDLLAAYAGYENEELKRVAVVNFDVWELGYGNRPSRMVSIQAPSGTSLATVRTLTSPEGASATNESFYWAGETWTYQSNGIGVPVPGQQQIRIVPDVHGQVSVAVGASEAVMVSFESVGHAW